MFEYGFTDWMGVLGLLIPHLVVSYVVLFIAAKTGCALARRNLKEIWPNHWATLLGSAAVGFGLVYLYIKLYPPGRRAFDYHLAGLQLPPGSESLVYHLLAIGALAVIVTLLLQHEARKQQVQEG